MVTIPDAIVYSDTPDAVNPSWAKSFLGFNATSSSAPIYEEVADIFTQSLLAPIHDRGSPILSGRFKCSVTSSGGNLYGCYTNTIINYVPNGGGGTLEMLKGDLNDQSLLGGKIFNPTTASTGLTGDQFLVGDYNGDGFDDIAMWNSATGQITVGLSRGPFGADFVFNVASTGVNIPGGLAFAGDFTGDGRFDIAIFSPSGSQVFVGVASVAGGTGNVTFSGWGTPWLASPNLARDFVRDFPWDASILVGHFVTTAREDMVFYSGGNNQWWVLKSNGVNAFTDVSWRHVTTDPVTQRAEMTLAMGIGTGGLDGIWLYDPYNNKYVTLKSTGASFTGSTASFGPTLPQGDIVSPYSGYPDGSLLASGLVTYDNSGEFFANAFTDTSGSVYYYQWNGWGPNVGNLFGW